MEDEAHEGLGLVIGLNNQRQVRTLAGIKALKWSAGRRSFSSVQPAHTAEDRS